MKIRSAIPEKGCLIFCGGRKKTENKKKQKNICKTYTHPPHRRLRKIAWAIAAMLNVQLK